MKIDLVIDSVHVARREGAPEALPRLPTLEAFVARGEPILLASPSTQTCLLGLFGLQDDAAAPIAALTLSGDNLPAGEDYWLRIDPVCLHATRTHILLAMLPENDLTLCEAQHLAGSLTAHLASGGDELVLGHPQRWYLRCASPPRLDTRSPWSCTGPLGELHLPSGPDGPYWRRLLTEAQMLLYPLEVNSAREASGKLPVTGIWPWGGGRPIRIAHSPYQLVCSDEPLARGLARAAGGMAETVPADANAAIAAAAGRSTVLVVIAVPPGGEAVLERDWLQPLAAALTQGRLAELGVLWLRDPQPLGRRLTRAHLRRWWRRPKPLTRDA